ncbi:MAG TPA: carboxypeptidase-like regulatory domain-containing protein [Phototrophicaceae bacterium]|nr:carboxypeptidase-like regulatory domain-containing protein [Phototrophicaceae bacterium]
MPTSVIGNLPTGSNSLYLFFDYENMTPETVYELRVTTNGIPNPTFSLAPVRWSGGERGVWYIGSSNQPWPNGVYEFILFANGIAAPAARITIGGSPETQPTFSDAVFALFDLQNNPYGNGFVLPTGNVASARFLFRNMEIGLEWTSIWYLNGSEFSRQANTWNEGASGSTTTSIRSETVLPPGSYRLELYIANRLATTSDFTIAGAAQGATPEIFRNEHFTTADNTETALTSSPLSNFPQGTASLYALFDWQQIAPGTLWTMRWTVDNEIFYEQTVPWNTLESGQNYLISLGAPGGVPDGTYRMDLLVNNVQLGSAQAQVGIGQLSIDPFAQASGVQLRGQILDADTREGIPGVSFILLSEAYSVSDFTWSQNQIYTMATTDRNGRFQLDRPLQLSLSEDSEIAYSAIIAAEGYLPINRDGIKVDNKTPNPLDITLYMIHD